MQACCPWGCRGCHGTPRFWQISKPYLNQGGQIMLTKLYWHPRIFRPSDGPALSTQTCHNHVNRLNSKFKFSTLEKNFKKVVKSQKQSFDVKFLVKTFGVNITFNRWTRFSKGCLQSYNRRIDRINKLDITSGKIYT